MTVLQLSTSFFHCPKPWQNFINHLIKKYDVKGDVPTSVIDNELKPYHAQYFEKVSHTLCIMFEAEKDYAWFVLRWS